jgi:superkiller protein 3
MSDKSKVQKKELQSLLKQAKKELQNEDFDECISISKSILKIDKSNFFAYIFLGKALQCKSRNEEALKNYVKATNLNPDQSLGWKGQLFIRNKDSDFVAFFDTLLGFAKILVQKNDPLTEVVGYINDYTKEHSLNFTPFKIYYLRQIIPGLSELGDIVGYQVDQPSNSLKTLIKIIETEETKRIENEKKKIKLTFSINMKERAKLDKYNEKIWPIISNSEIPQLYELLINLEQVDSERYKAQENYLMYKYNLLNVAPSKDKPSLRMDILDIVEGLILIKCPSRFAWNLYFDWLDPNSLSDLELDKISTYISIFGKDNAYGSIFYHFLISDISPFEKSKIVDYLKPLKKKSKKKSSIPQEIEGEHELETNVINSTIKVDDIKNNSKELDERFKIFDVQPQEILTSFLKCLRKIQSSVICCRIVLDYCVHLKDFVIGLEVSEYLTKALGLLKSLTGLSPPHSKLAQTLNLAIIYTYYESPKNFPKALALYDSISEKDPNNDMIKIGKALILVETKNFLEASKIFKQLIEKDPFNVDAIQEYGWCQLHLENYNIGREYLERAISILQNDENKNLKTTNAMEVLSTLTYRLGISYFMEFDDPKCTFDANTLGECVKKCLSLLLKCLKLAPNYAPAFTTLGLVYYNYLDNKDRAIKIFYKAFQLDPAEIQASYKLAEHFTKVNDWEMADIICKAVIENDRAKRQLSSNFNKIADSSWPYRILGCASMEFKKDAKAIEYFQSALRMNPLDVPSWLGLGEAYTSRGRIEASIKVFNHVIRIQAGVEDNNAEITPEMEKKADWHAIYLLALSLTKLLEYEKSIKLLLNLLENNKEQIGNVCVLTLLVETLVLRCQSEIHKGAILRASDTLMQLFEYIFQAFEFEKKSIKLWKILSDSLLISLNIQSVISKLPFEKIHVLVAVIINEENSLWEELNFEDFDIVSLTNEKKYLTVFHIFYTLSCIGGYLCLNYDDIRVLRSSLIYNIAVSLISWCHDSNNELYRDVAIKLLNKAIGLEPENPEFWNSLGIISLNKNARISQHCFIKALSIDSKSASYWFNLGILYIKYHDYELANECFVRTQSIAANTSIPWIGQAIINKESGNLTVAKNLFTHSYVLSNGNNPSYTLLYAVSVLESIFRDNDEERDLDSIQQLTAVNYGMMNYLKLYPNDVFALELAIKVVERLYSFTKGISFAEKLCRLLETKYEETESEVVLVSFCKVKCQLSRLLLAKGEYIKAYELCEEIGSLLDSVDTLTVEVQKCLLSCFTVLGLSLYFLGEFDKSIIEFKKLLETFPENNKIVVLISQVLYASGEEGTKQAAMDELLSNIESHGTSLIVSMTIAAISLAEDWEEYIVAVREVLEQLPLDTLIKDTYNEIPKLLNMISDKLNNSSGKAQNARISKIWHRNAILFPGDSSIWNHIDKEISLELFIKSKKESVISVSEAYVNVKRLREVQRGILLSGGISEEGLSVLGALVKQECK